MPRRRRSRQLGFQNPLSHVDAASKLKFVLLAGLVAGVAMLINMHLFQSIMGKPK